MAALSRKSLEPALDLRSDAGPRLVGSQAPVDPGQLLCPGLDRRLRRRHRVDQILGLETGVRTL